MEAVNDYLRYPVLSTPEPRDIMMRKHWQWLTQRKAVEESHRECISQVSVFNAIANALAELSDNPEIQYELMDFITECTIHASLNYDAVFLLPYRPAPDWLMPAHDVMKQLMIEHSAALGGEIFMVHQVRGTSKDEQVADCVTIIDKMIEVRAKIKAHQVGEKLPESNGDH
jgi:hypothetical protein